MTHSIHHHHQANVTGAQAALRRPEPSEHDKIVKQAQKWVAQTFYGTLLKQARQSPFHSKLFEGGRGGDAFGSLFDQNLADHMSRSGEHRDARKHGKVTLAESIARKIEAKKAYSKAEKTPPKNPSFDTKPSLMRSNHATTALRA